MVDILYVVMVVYLLVGTAKLILTIPSIPASIAATAWAITRKKGAIEYKHVALVLSVTLFACYFWWIPLLIIEKHRFFLSYSTREAIREAIYVQRLVDEDLRGN